MTKLLKQPRRYTINRVLGIGPVIQLGTTNGRMLELSADEWRRFLHDRGSVSVPFSVKLTEKTGDETSDGGPWNIE